MNEEEYLAFVKQSIIISINQNKNLGSTFKEECINYIEQLSKKEKIIDELKEDIVVGYLTANNVFKRIKKHLNSKKIKNNLESKNKYGGNYVKNKRN